ncbi:MAG TPA: SRPBCC family protein, partial [Mucilaginibacter sp.]
RVNITSHSNGLININWPERYLSVAAGVEISLSGIRHIFKHPFASIVKIGAGGYLLNRGITGHCEIYSQMGKTTTEPVNVTVRSSIMVNRPRMEVYSFWRKLDNLPLFMNHLEGVEMIDSHRSRWALKIPTGLTTVNWEAEIVQDIPGQLIGWSSLPDSMIDNAGKIRFRDAEDGNGTLVDITISYQPPAGGFGASLAHVLNPVFKNMVDNDARNFKQYMDIDSNNEVIVIVEE